VSLCPAAHSSVAAQRPESPAITVGPVTHVSAALPRWQHTEYLADANPSPDGSLVLCSMLYSPARAQQASAIYQSADGGRSWRLSLLDSANRFLRGITDPTCAFDPSGQLLFATITRDHLVRLHRSFADGASWEPVTIADTLDYPKLLVDRTGGPFHGRIYLHGNHEPERVWMASSADRGGHFIRSATRSLDSVWALSWGRGTVMRDGTVMMPYLVTRPNAPIEGGAISVVRSDDGGATVSAPIRVAQLAQCPRAAGQDVAMMAADLSRSVFRGRAYVVWNARYRGHCSIMLAYSDDRGTTWSEPLRVSDERARRDTTTGPTLSLPAIEVNSGGVVGVTWYDRRADPANRDYQLRFSASLDGGDTWLPSVPTSSQRFVFRDNPEYPLLPTVRQLVSAGSRRRYGFQTTVIPGQRLYDGWNAAPGDYAGIATTPDGRFHTFWIANPTGVAQVYSAAVSVNGKVMRDGSEELAGMDELSPHVQLRYTSSVYDPATHRIRLGLQLVNTSRDTIVGPLKVRLLHLDSDLGPPRLQAAEGDGRASSAPIVDLTPTLRLGRLNPGDTTSTRMLTWEIRPFETRLRGAYARDVVRFDARVFGHRRASSP
jgi:hypothetical protein